MNAPCEECARQALCKKNELACEAFEKFVDGEYENHTQDANGRFPSRLIFLRVFSDFGDEMTALKWEAA
jgi:hypothetical protein